VGRGWKRAKKKHRIVFVVVYRLKGHRQIIVVLFSREEGAATREARGGKSPPALAPPPPPPRASPGKKTQHTHPPHKADLQLA
jgi:hypothetical protein